MIGTFSHIALDALMHPDMHPFWPIMGGNPWLGSVSVGSVHLACGLAGLAGAAVIALRMLRA
jgi:membrane-bound metal-dependent hydrolase YbcI (DUF457 family)